jgi:hypothetical protein
MVSPPHNHSNNGKLCFFDRDGMADSTPIATHLVKRHALTRMIDMYLGESSPQPWIGSELVKDEKGKRIKMVDGWAPADWTFGIEAISTMVCSLITSNMTASKPSPTLIVSRGNVLHLLFCAPFGILR